MINKLTSLGLTNGKDGETIFNRLI
jgi:hypothetical protein